MLVGLGAGLIAQMIPSTMIILTIKSYAALYRNLIGIIANHMDQNMEYLTVA